MDTLHGLKFRCFWPNCREHSIGIYSIHCPRVNYCKYHLVPGTRVEIGVVHLVDYKEKIELIARESRNVGRIQILPRIAEEKPSLDDVIIEN